MITNEIINDDSKLDNDDQKNIHLFYQTLISSKKDLANVTDKKSYLIMVLLRMMTFVEQINSNSMDSPKKKDNIICLILI